MDGAALLVAQAVMLPERLIRSIVRRLGVPTSRHDFEDCLQEARLEAWLCRAAPMRVRVRRARNRVIDYLRYTQRRDALPLRGDYARPLPDIDAWLDGTAWLRRLELRRRRAAWAIGLYVLGYRMHEIGRMAGISESLVSREIREGRAA